MHYLVVGAEVEQSPGGVHEIGEVVEEAESGPHSLDAHLFEAVVLRRHCYRETELQRNR